MSSSMITRKAHTVDLELKLKAALHELKATKELNSNLLCEREEVEEVIKELNNKNAMLKHELSQLYCTFKDTVGQRDKLEEQISSFRVCNETHEEALNHICDLKVSLREARKSISILEESKMINDHSTTQSLFEELVTCDSELQQRNSCIGQNTTPIPNSFKSHNKLKKYIKIKKIIRKTRNLMRREKLTTTCTQFRKERFNFINTINNLEEQLITSSYTYERETQELQVNLLELEKDLGKIADMYQDCQELLKKQTVEIDSLTRLSHYNEDRLESLTSKCECVGSQSTYNPYSQLPGVPAAAIQTKSQSVVSQQVQQSVQPGTAGRVHNIVLFSDAIGVGLGKALKCYIDQPVINICSPGIHFSKLVSSIQNTSLDSHSTAIILFGDSVSATRKEVINLIDTMNTLQVKVGCRFIVCALPYSHMLTQKQNTYIHSLNSLIYNTTHSHSDILFFDTNKFISKFYLTKDTLYLPIYFKRQIAKLLAYNILHTDTGTNTVLKHIPLGSNTTVPINTGTDMVSNHSLGGKVIRCNVDTSNNLN